MIDTILFDLDNTILDFNKAERNALKAALEHLDVSPSPRMLARYSEINLAQWKLLERGELTRPEVKDRRFRFLFHEFGIDRSPFEANRLYEQLLGNGADFVEGAEEVLRGLSGRFRLYIVTNGTATVQKRRIENAGISPYFRDIFISQEIGANKPDKLFFDRCFLRIPDFHKDRTVIIGDSLTSDIQGGKNAGIQTVWFNPRREPIDPAILPDYEIHTLQDIFKLFF